MTLPNNMDNTVEMNANGTYVLIYSDKDSGSLRRKYGLPASLGIEMSIKHTDYVDSKTKVSGKRHVVRLDKFVAIDAAGTIAPVSTYVVCAVPESTIDLTTSVNQLVSTLVQLLGNQSVAAADQMNKATGIFIGGEQ